jgi:hypothetical protein
VQASERLQKSFALRFHQHRDTAPSLAKSSAPIDFHQSRKRNGVYNTCSVFLPLQVAINRVLAARSIPQQEHRHTRQYA